MQVEKELANLTPERDTMLTIGVFDGVHLGHKYLISQLLKHAGEQNLFSGVVTFRQHPQELMSPQGRGGRRYFRPVLYPGTSRAFSP